MAEVTINVNSIDTDWSSGTGSVTDIDEAIADADGAQHATTLDTVDEQIVLGLQSPGLSDSDTISNVSVTIRYRDTGTAGTRTCDVDLIVGGTSQGTVNTGDVTGTLADYGPLNTAGWNSDWSQTQLDGMQVGLTPREAGMPGTNFPRIDCIDVVITYTAGASTTEETLAATATVNATLTAQTIRFYRQTLSATVTVNTGTGGTSEIIVPQTQKKMFFAPDRLIPNRREFGWFWDKNIFDVYDLSSRVPRALIGGRQLTRTGTPDYVTRSKGRLWNYGSGEYWQDSVFPNVTPPVCLVAFTECGTDTQNAFLSFGNNAQSDEYLSILSSSVASLRFRYQYRSGSGAGAPDSTNFADPSGPGPTGVSLTRPNLFVGQSQSTTRHEVWANGTLVEAQSVTVTPANITTVNFLEFGRLGDASPFNSTDAGIYWAAILNDTLSPDEIRKLAANPFGIFQSAPSRISVTVGASDELSHRVTYSRKLNATGAVSATLNRFLSAFRRLPVTVTGSATLTVRRIFSNIKLAATVTANAALSRVVLYVRKLAATVVAAATVTATAVTAGLTAVTLAATVTCTATVSFIRVITLAATATAAATMNRTLLLFRTLAAKVGQYAKTADFIRFDGASTVVEWTTGLSTAADGRAITISHPQNRKGSSADECLIYLGTTTGETVFLGYRDGRLVARLSDGSASPVPVREIISTKTFSDSVNRVIVWGADLDGTVYVLADGESVQSGATPSAGSSSVGGSAPLYTVTLAATANVTAASKNHTVSFAGNLDFTDKLRIGATDNSSSRQWFSGAAGHTYIEFAYYAPDEVSYFYDAYGNGPIDHGDDGSASTNVTPPLYWRPTAENPLVNNGTGGNADTGSVFSDETSPPLLRRLTAALTARATFVRTLAATLVAAATIAARRTASVRMAATALITAVLSRRLFLKRTFAATATVNATLNRTLLLFRKFAATVVVVATISASKLGGALNTVTLAATATVNATVSLVMTYSRRLAATVTAAATISRVVTYMRDLSATATLAATLSRRVTYLRTLAATAVNTATVTARRVFSGITLAATVTATATLSRVALFRRTLAATVSAVATLTTRTTFFRTLAATVTAAATLTRGAASTLYTVSLAATATISAGLSYLYTIFKRPFTGHGGIGLKDERTRWSMRRSTWRRRK